MSARRLVYAATALFVGLASAAVLFWMLAARPNDSSFAVAVALDLTACVCLALSAGFGASASGSPRRDAVVFGLYVLGFALVLISVAALGVWESQVET